MLESHAEKKSYSIFSILILISILQQKSLKVGNIWVVNLFIYL